MFNAMLICDHTIREEITGKVSLIGIFGVISSPSFPLIHRSLCVYVNLSDAQGLYLLRLELLEADTMRIIGRAEASFEVADGRFPAEVVFDLPGLAFDHAGLYMFQLYANNDSLGSKSFHVIQSNQPPGET
jgi:hypothetical protein